MFGISPGIQLEYGNIIFIDGILISSVFSGLYGDLVVSRVGVFVKHPYSGEISASFDWSQLSHIHLANYGHSEDVKRIVVVHTTAKFEQGAGELHFFCQDAGRLLKDLVTQGRGPRKNQITHNQRPLSYSESDLYALAENQYAELLYEKNKEMSFDDVSRDALQVVGGKLH